MNRNYRISHNTVFGKVLNYFKQQNYFLFINVLFIFICFYILKILHFLVWYFLKMSSMIKDGFKALEQDKYDLVQLSTSLNAAVYIFLNWYFK